MDARLLPMHILLLAAVGMVVAGTAAVGAAHQATAWLDKHRMHNGYGHLTTDIFRLRPPSILFPTLTDVVNRLQILEN
jgi:hypothetical protein